MFSVLVPLVLVIGCVAALAPRSLQSPRLLLRHVSSFARILPSDDYDEWWKQSAENEEVVFKVTDVSAGLPEGYSFLDASSVAVDGAGPSDRYFISEMTLREISEAYLFSLSYLGDFVVQLGCQPPIDVDTNVGNYLVGEQVYSLLEAVNSLDPVESHCEYDSLTVRELADELDVSMGRMMKIVQNERVNLPFGLDTTLHTAVVERIREVHQYDEYVESELEDDEDGDGQGIDEYGDRRRGGYSLN